MKTTSSSSSHRTDAAAAAAAAADDDDDDVAAAAAAAAAEGSSPHKTDATAAVEMPVSVCACICKKVIELQILTFENTPPNSLRYAATLETNPTFSITCASNICLLL